MRQCFTTCNDCLPPSPPTPPARPLPPLHPGQVVNQLHLDVDLDDVLTPLNHLEKQFQARIGSAVQSGIEGAIHEPVAQTADGFWTLVAGLAMLAVGLVALVIALLSRSRNAQRQPAPASLSSGDWEALSQSPGGLLRVPVRVMEAFDRFDVDHSGYIERGELHSALRHYGVDLSAPGAEGLLARYDNNPDGVVDLTEFAQLVRDLEEGMLRSQSAAAAAAAASASGVTAPAMPSPPPQSPPPPPSQPPLSQPPPQGGQWLPPSATPPPHIPANAAAVADRWENENRSQTGPYGNFVRTPDSRGQRQVSGHRTPRSDTRRV